MSKKHSIIIIGNGVAANVLGFYLRKNESTRTSHITKIYDDQTYRPCSKTTTSHNCLRNAQLGLSPLGDNLVHAADEFKAFYDEFKPDGVYPCGHKHYWREDYDKAHKMERRYRGLEYKSKDVPYFQNNLTSNFMCADNEAYVIESERYLEYLSNQTNYDEIINKRVSTLDDLEADQIFLCTGQYTKYFHDAFDDETHVLGSKPVAGTYLEFSIDEFDISQFNQTSLENGFCFDLENVNIVYQPKRQKVLIGATSTTDNGTYVHDADIFTMYENVANAMEGVLTLPSKDKAKLVTGIRQKGHRRQPFWGEISSNTYAIYGLYKNAYTFSNLASRSLISKIYGV